MIAKAVPARISTHPRTGHSGRDRHYAGALGGAGVLYETMAAMGLAPSADAVQ
jgi:hypothetical protein